MTSTFSVLVNMLLSTKDWCTCLTNFLFIFKFIVHHSPASIITAYNVLEQMHDTLGKRVSLSVCKLLGNMLRIIRIVVNAYHIQIVGVYSSYNSYQYGLLHRCKSLCIWLVHHRFAFVSTTFRILKYSLSTL